MAGKPGRSGGTRPGAGPKFKSWRLENGAILAAFETADGKRVGMGRMATVHVENRNVMILKLDDGTELKLVR
jgi:hypothetical protein